MQGDQNPSIVLQNGSSICRAGFSGDDAPRVAFPSVLGHPKHVSIMLGQQKDDYFGDDAISKRGVLNLKYPIERGQVIDFDRLQKLWRHTFLHQLRIDPEQQNVLLSEATSQNPGHRQKKAQIMFQSMKVPGMYLVNRLVLAMYSTGRLTGVSIHTGEMATQYAVVKQGKIMKNRYLMTHIAGKEVVNYLNHQMTLLGLSFSTSAQMLILKDMKQKLCYVALNAQQQQKIYQESAAPGDQKGKFLEYVLPDQSIIRVKDQAFKATQVMFDPKLIGQDAYGMHWNVQNLIKSLEQTQMIKEMYKNIVLGGGNSKFIGMKQRLQKQISQLALQNFPTKVISIPDQAHNASWIGGSILSSLTTFQHQWVTKAEYDQHGPSIVNTKCV